MNTQTTLRGLDSTPRNNDLLCRDFQRAEAMREICCIAANTAEEERAEGARLLREGVSAVVAGACYLLLLVVLGATVAVALVGGR